MSVLTGRKILEAMSKPDGAQRLLITPLLDPRQVGNDSVDLRLGHEFIVFNQALLGAIDPARVAEIEVSIRKYEQRIRIRLRETFVLHPGQFALGATLEYLVLPRNLAAEVSGRSTWGRTGLLIATATMIAPGFKGCITLELANDGVVPVVLRPGELVAQVRFTRTEGSASYDGSYLYSTGPSFPRFKAPKDAMFWWGRIARVRSRR